VAEFAWRILVLVVALVVILVVSRNWTRWEGGPGWQRTNDAYLQADLTPITAKVAGYLRALPVQDFQRVHAGDVLAQLVDDDYRASVTQAEATIAADEAQSEVLRAQHELQLANIQSSHAVVASTEAAAVQNERDLTRQHALLDTGSSSTEAREKLETLHAQLVAQLAQNRAQALAAQRQLAVLDSQLAQSEAALALPDTLWVAEVGAWKSYGPRKSSRGWPISRAYRMRSYYRRRWITCGCASATIRRGRNSRGRALCCGLNASPAASQNCSRKRSRLPQGSFELPLVPCY